jgi:hypothetical protein
MSKRKKLELLIKEEKLLREKIMALPNKFMLALTFFIVLCMFLIMVPTDSNAFIKAGDRCKSNPNKTLFLMDISGSMSGVKFQNAKTTLNSHLTSNGAKFQSALMTFQGCKQRENITLRAGFKANNAKAINESLAGVIPANGTPLEKAISKAEATLAAEGGCANLVILSDGVESCGGNPQRASDGIKQGCTCINIIGIDIPEWKKDELKRLADNYCDASKGNVEDCLTKLDPSVKDPAVIKDPKDPKVGDPKDPPTNLPACRMDARIFKSGSQVCECKKPMKDIGGVCKTPITSLPFCKKGRNGAGKTCRCKTNQKIKNGACVPAKIIIKPGREQSSGKSTGSR